SLAALETLHLIVNIPQLLFRSPDSIKRGHLKGYKLRRFHRLAFASAFCFSTVLSTYPIPVVVRCMLQLNSTLGSTSEATLTRTLHETAGPKLSCGLGGHTTTPLR